MLVTCDLSLFWESVVPSVLKSEIRRVCSSHLFPLVLCLENWKATLSHKLSEYRDPNGCQQTIYYWLQAAWKAFVGKLKVQCPLYIAAPPNYYLWYLPHSSLLFKYFAIYDNRGLKNNKSFWRVQCTLNWSWGAHASCALPWIRLWWSEPNSPWKKSPFSPSLLQLSWFNLWMKMRVYHFTVFHNYTHILIFKFILYI